MSSGQNSGALLTHARVVHALVLRDIKTRTGGSYFGFLFGLVMPLGHIGLVLLIYVILGRKSPIGTDAILFLASAILPFIIWSYTHQKMILAFGQNQALMSFPVVGIAEIAVARAIVELLTATLVVMVTLLALWVVGVDMLFHDKKLLLMCLFLSYVFGVSTGLIVGIISLLNHLFSMAGFLLMPLFWLTSGVFFTPDVLPEMARRALSVFVIANIVDFARNAIYSEYISSFPDMNLILFAIVANFLIATALSKAMRVSLSTR